MVRENERKKRWSAYISAKLDELGLSAADLARATDLSDATVSNWKVGRAGISSEAALVVAGALQLAPSEVLREAGFPILADAMEGKELRLVGAPATEPIDPGILEILATKELPESTKAVMINWWRRRRAEDEARRRADAEQMLELKKQDSA